MRIIASLIFALSLSLTPAFAEDGPKEKAKETTGKSNEASAKSKGEKKSKPISEDNSVAKVGKDTGELASRGAVETGKAAKKGALWIARPWSKDKSKTKN